MTINIETKISKGVTVKSGEEEDEKIDSLSRRKVWSEIDNAKAKDKRKRNSVVIIDQPQ